MTEYNVHDSKTLHKAIDIIQSGGVVLCPTDTVYGLICDAKNIKAIKRIYEIKQRVKEKKLSLFVPSVEYINTICQVTQNQNNVLKKFLPGAFTFVLNTLAYEVNENKTLSILNEYANKTIGIRIPNNEFLISLLKKFNSAIASTSANISGTFDTSIYKSVQDDVKHTVDLCIADENTIENSSSSVIDISSLDDNWRFVIYRHTKHTKDFIEYINKLSGKKNVTTLRNIGKAVSCELYKIGIYNTDDFKKYSPAEIYKMLIESNKKNKHTMLLYALYGAVFDINCLYLPEDIKKIALNDFKLF